LPLLNAKVVVVIVVFRFDQGVSVGLNILRGFREYEVGGCDQIVFQPNLAEAVVVFELGLEGNGQEDDDG